METKGDMFEIVDNSMPYEEYKKQQEQRKVEIKRQEIKEKNKAAAEMSKQNGGVDLVNIVDNSQEYKSKEEKEYLICLTMIDDDTQEWHIIKGRTEVYNFLKDVAGVADTGESFVLVETLPLSKRVSVYTFLKYVQDNYEDGFDVDDYVSNTPEDFSYAGYDRSGETNNMAARMDEIRKSSPNLSDMTIEG